MRYWDFEPDVEIVVRATTRREAKRAGRRPIRRPLTEVLADLDATRQRYDGLVAAGAHGRAGELAGDLDRLTREIGARRLAPPVRPPV
jgi:hypothetical protein